MRGTTIKKIDAKRKGFLVPLQNSEDVLLTEIDAAFDELISANAAVTAHLNSVLKVQELQDKLVGKAGLSDIRNKVKTAIEGASDYVTGAVNQYEEEAKTHDPTVPAH